MMNLKQCAGYTSDIVDPTLCLVASLLNLIERDISVRLFFISTGVPKFPIDHLNILRNFN
jgi:hypothetical protein